MKKRKFTNELLDLNHDSWPCSQEKRIKHLKTQELDYCIKATNIKREDISAFRLNSPNDFLYDDVTIWDDNSIYEKVNSIVVQETQNDFNSIVTSPSLSNEACWAIIDSSNNFLSTPDDSAAILDQQLQNYNCLTPNKQSYWNFSKEKDNDKIKCWSICDKVIKFLNETTSDPKDSFVEPILTTDNPSFWKIISAINFLKKTDDVKNQKLLNNNAKSSILISDNCHSSCWDIIGLIIKFLKNNPATESINDAQSAKDIDTVPVVYNNVNFDYTTNQSISNATNSILATDNDSCWNIINLAIKFWKEDNVCTTSSARNNVTNFTYELQSNHEINIKPMIVNNNQSCWDIVDLAIKILNNEVSNACDTDFTITSCLDDTTVDVYETKQYLEDIYLNTNEKIFLPFADYKNENNETESTTFQSEQTIQDFNQEQFLPIDILCPSFFDSIDDFSFSNYIDFSQQNSNENMTKSLDEMHSSVFAAESEFALVSESVSKPVEVSASELTSETSFEFDMTDLLFLDSTDLTSQKTNNFITELLDEIDNSVSVAEPECVTELAPVSDAVSNSLPESVPKTISESLPKSVPVSAPEPISETVVKCVPKSLNKHVPKFKPQVKSVPAYVDDPEIPDYVDITSRKSRRIPCSRYANYKTKKNHDTREIFRFTKLPSRQEPQELQMIDIIESPEKEPVDNTNEKTTNILECDNNFPVSQVAESETEVLCVAEDEKPTATEQPNINPIINKDEEATSTEIIEEESNDLIFNETHNNPNINEIPKSKCVLYWDEETSDIQIIKPNDNNSMYDEEDEYLDVFKTPKFNIVSTECDEVTKSSKNKKISQYACKISCIIHEGEFSKVIYDITYHDEYLPQTYNPIAYRRYSLNLPLLADSPYTEIVLYYGPLCQKSFKKIIINCETSTKKQKSSKIKYHCSVKGCNKIYNTLSNLTFHQKSHAGTSSFKCHFIKCQQHFVRRSDLTRHLRLHVALRPFICKTCHKQFTRNDHLKSHLKTHRVKVYKPYKSRTSKYDILKNELLQNTVE